VVASSAKCAFDILFMRCRREIEHMPSFSDYEESGRRMRAGYPALRGTRRLSAFSPMVLTHHTQQLYHRRAHTCRPRLPAKDGSAAVARLMSAVAAKQRATRPLPPAQPERTGERKQCPAFRRSRVASAPPRHCRKASEQRGGGLPREGDIFALATYTRRNVPPP